MKPENPDVIEVTHLEVEAIKSVNGGKWNYQHLAHRYTMKTKNDFVQPFTEYVVTLTNGGFKIKKPTINDAKVRKSTMCGHLYCSGVEPGLYDIIEQNEDFIICQKQSA